MEQQRNKLVRNPQQSRSIMTKEKILDTAYLLFCRNGYNKTTTNEIAKVAGVSIGSLYSYFNDKYTIFMKILDIYNNSFLDILIKTNDVYYTSNITDIYKQDKKKWLFLIINNFIKAHESSKNLNRELIIMYNSNIEVASVIDKHKKKVEMILMDRFKYCESDIKVTDMEAASIIVFDLINALIDRIIFGKNIMDSKRLIDAGIDAIYKYLFI